MLSLGAFDVVHDGYDIVITGRGESRPVLIDRGSPQAIEGDRVAPALWRAFIRDPNSPQAYLDLEQLREGSVIVHYQSVLQANAVAPQFHAQPNRYLKIPISDDSTQLEWLNRWADSTLKDHPVIASELESVAPDGGVRGVTKWLHKQATIQILLVTRLGGEP